MSTEVERCPDCESEAIEIVNDRLAKCTECLTVEHQDLFTTSGVTHYNTDPVAEVSDTVRVEWETRWLGREKSEELIVDKVDEDGVYMKIDGGWLERWKFVPHIAFHKGEWEVVDK